MKTTWFVAVLATATTSVPVGHLRPHGSPPSRGAQTATQANLPYAAVHDPEFLKVSDAPFMKDDDRVIGLMSGNVAKAYSAGILSQHGLVEDQSPKGPIAITW
jgi:hypothetical protein